MPFVSNDGIAPRHRQGQAGSNAACEEFDGMADRFRPAMSYLMDGHGH